VETKRIRYLLGVSSQAEREQIESEYFADDHAFQEMLAAENDLIDAYARGELTRDERRRFEKHFLTSPGGSDRVQFARAFAGAVSGDVRPHETKLRATLLDGFREWRGALERAAITAVVVLVVVLSWQLMERRRMNNELRVEYSEPGKQIESLQRDAERTRITSTTAQPENLPAPSDELKQRPTNTTRATHLPTSKTNNRELLTSIGREHREEDSLRSVDPRLGIDPRLRSVLQLAVDDRRTPSLMALTPAWIAVFPLRSRRTDETTITVARWVTAIRLQLDPETAAKYREYRAVIETADRRPITSFHWAEPLQPNHNGILTPPVPTVYLSSGDYAIFVTGKDRDGSFVRVAEYSFRLVRDSGRSKSRSHGDTGDSLKN